MPASLDPRVHRPGGPIRGGRRRREMTGPARSFDPDATWRRDRGGDRGPGGRLGRGAASLLVAGLLVLAPASLAPLAPPVARASVTAEYASAGHAPVAPGVEHDWGSIVTDRTGRQVVHLLDIDPSDPAIGLQASLATDEVVGRAAVSSQALDHSTDGHRVVAAVNGDVWGGYTSTTQDAPNGLDIQAGELVTTGPLARPTFGIDGAGHPLIGTPLVTAFITQADGTIRFIDRVNQGRAEDEFVLYTPRWGPTTPRDVGGTDAVLGGVALPLRPIGVHQAIVREVRPASGGIPIAPDSVVLNGPTGSLLDYLVPGQTIQLTFSITPGWETVQEAVGGRELIVQDGVTDISPRPASADQVHPRTAIGITASGHIVMATVDGRQPGYSMGVDLEELADLMLSQGAVTALNMDGGGSTTMAVRQPGDVEVSVVNRPSGGSQRAVANSVLVYSRVPTGPLATVDVNPGHLALWKGESATFAVKGQDAAYNGVPLDPSEMAWSVQGPGTVTPSGRYSATDAGTATVVASARGVSGTAAVTVTADVYPPVVRAPGHRLASATALSSNRVPLDVEWAAATDKGRGVARYELEQSVDGGAWAAVPLPGAADRNASLMLSVGHAYRYRVRAVDRAGNVGAWATGPAFRLGAVQESSRVVVRRGHWARRDSSAFFGGHAISATATGTSVKIAFVGQQIAWVSALGPSRGAARVYVDGSYVQTVDLRKATVATRRIVFTRSWSSTGNHTLEIRVAGTPGPPRVDVDAFVSTALLP